MDAIEALSTGLVDELLPEKDGEVILDRWIRDEILPLSASSLRRARRASRWALHKTLETGLDDLEHLYLQDLMKTHDAVEGIEAFLENRQPVWTHE